ncbi:hypothetical protein Pmani_001284 [Petrolisthes manimaculis]|uniref:Uncharacterized protein n=1 Tax=Petrolisthes manimaculis TaxID=1843537 RepID=A0AAE1QKU5_9EUCA|nr:hypothetical protein Pmani_001284 [Petrolisthes manimaculis]
MRPGLHIHQQYSPLSPVSRMAGLQPSWRVNGKFILAKLIEPDEPEFLELPVLCLMFLVTAPQPHAGQLCHKANRKQMGGCQFLKAVCASKVTTPTPTQGCASKVTTPTPTQGCMCFKAIRVRSFEPWLVSLTLDLGDGPCVYRLARAEPPDTDSLDSRE